MKHLTLGHIVATYKIDGYAQEVFEKYQEKLITRAYNRKCMNDIVDTEKLYCNALKLTERYAKMYHGVRTWEQK